MSNSVDRRHLPGGWEINFVCTNCGGVVINAEHDYETCEVCGGRYRKVKTYKEKDNG